MRIFILLTVLLSSNAVADIVPKNNTDKFLVAASTVSLITDWGTTLDLENHPDRHETNPILGKYPSRGEINTYFGSLLLVHILANVGINHIKNKNVRAFMRGFENSVVFFSHYEGASINIKAGMSINF